MKISKPAIILSTAGLGLTLVYSQQSTSDTPTKAQQILRQKLTELKTGETLPGKDALLADIERLHKEGKISDEQFASFKKNINEKYSSPEGPADSEAQAKAQRILEQRIAVEKAGTQPSNSEIQAKAQKALEETAKAQARKTAAAAQPATSTATEQALRQKISDPKAEEKPVVAVSNTEAQTKALRVLEEQRTAQKPPPPTKPSTTQTTVAEKAQKVAEPKAEPKPVVTASNTEAQTKALKVLEEQRTAQKPPPPTKPSTTQTTVAEKAQKVAEPKAEPKPVVTASNTEAQAKAVAPVQAGDAEARAGITPETSRRTRLLRLKIAESKGLITPEEAAQAAAAASAAPIFTSNKVGMERLLELTDAYKDDRITPAQYHQERAKIVSSF